MALVETARCVVREEGDFLPDSGKKSNGRPPNPLSLHAISKRIGVPMASLPACQVIRAAAAFVSLAPGTTLAEGFSRRCPGCGHVGPTRTFGVVSVVSGDGSG